MISDAVPRHLRPTPWDLAWPAAWIRARMRLLRWEHAGLLILLTLSSLLHLTNMFNYPRYQQDEGTYMANAWSLGHGALSPYTYTYGHPPLAWAMINAWIHLTGGFFTFGTAINSGRVFIFWIVLISALLVYALARRISGSPWTALVAVALFSLSPISVNYQRQVLIDNIAVFWLLLALYLLFNAPQRLGMVTGSALCFGAACLSKETMVVLLPGFLYAVWLLAAPFQRRFALIVFGYTSMALFSVFVLVAVLKGELFPTGTLLGGTHPHVSLITTFLGQAARGSDGGSFGQGWHSWWHDDALLMGTGLGALGLSLLLIRWWPVLRIFLILTLLYWGLLARGGVTLHYYIIPILPLQALTIALVLHHLVEGVELGWQKLARWRHLPAPASARLLRVLVMVGMLVMLGLRAVPANRTNLQTNGTAPENAALVWVGAHVPRSAVVVVNNYAWLEMHVPGGLAASYGVPFNNVQMYWPVATDPAVSETILHNDWENIDYVLYDPDMKVDAHLFHMHLILDALKHAVLVARFANSQFWIDVYRVQHRQQAIPDTADPHLLQQLTAPSGS